MAILDNKLFIKETKDVLKQFDQALLPSHDRAKKTISIKNI